MSENKQHSLFRLIHSMDGTEKAYFKKYGFKRENKNNDSFIALFDLVDKQDTFNIIPLKRSNKINASHKKNIHAALNSLFKTLTHSLIDYRKDKSNIAQMFTMLSEYDLYKEKKLIDIAEKKLQQLEEFVEAHNMFYFKAYIYQVKGSLLQNNIIANRENLTSYFEKLDNAKRELDINIESNKFSLQIEELFHRNGGVVNKSKEALSNAEKLIENANRILELSKDNFLFTSVITNNRFIIQLMAGRLDDLDDHVLQFLEKYDRMIDKKYSDIALGDILVTLKNFSIVCMYLGKLDLYYKLYNRLAKDINLYKSEEAIRKLNFRLLHLRISNFAVNATAPVTEKDINEALEIMNQMFKNKSQYAETLLNCMIALIRMDKLERALDISEHYIHEQHNERIRDGDISIKMVRAVVRYKMEQFELYESEIQSLYRKLKSLNTLQLQQFVVKELQKVQKLHLPDDKKKLRKHLQEKYDEILSKGTGSEMIKCIEIKTISDLVLVS